MRSCATICAPVAPRGGGRPRSVAEERRDVAPQRPAPDADAKVDPVEVAVSEMHQGLPLEIPVDAPFAKEGVDVVVLRRDTGRWIGRGDRYVDGGRSIKGRRQFGKGK